jgi:hypothetical protein
MRDYSHIPIVTTYATFIASLDDELARCTEVDEVSGAQCYRRLGHHIAPCNGLHHTTDKCLKKMHIAVYHKAHDPHKIPTQTKWFSPEEEDQP